MTFDPSGKTVDQILDYGAPGLRYWEHFLPLYAKAFGAPLGAELAELFARYDEQRGMSLTEFDTARNEMDKALADADSRFVAHRAVANSLPTAWTGATGAEALALMNSQLRQARTDLDTIRAASGAIAAAIDPMRQAVLAKAEHARALLEPTSDGEGRLTIDGRTPDAIESIAPTDPWLTGTFRTDVDHKLAAFTAACTATADTFESHYRAISTAFAQVIDHPYPQPAPTLLPQQDPAPAPPTPGPKQREPSAARPVPSPLPNPTTGRADPATGQTGPASGPGNPAAGQTDAASGQGNSAAGQTDPAAAQGNPTAGEADPVAGQSDPAVMESDPAGAKYDPAGAESNAVGVQPCSVGSPSGEVGAPSTAGSRVPTSDGGPACCQPPGVATDAPDSARSRSEGRTCPTSTRPERAGGNTDFAGPASTASLAPREPQAAVDSRGDVESRTAIEPRGGAEPAPGAESAAGAGPRGSSQPPGAAVEPGQASSDRLAEALKGTLEQVGTSLQQGISATLEKLGFLADPISPEPVGSGLPEDSGHPGNAGHPASPGGTIDSGGPEGSTPAPHGPEGANLPTGHVEFDIAGKHFVLDRTTNGDMSVAVTDESGRTHTWTLKDHTGNPALTPDNPAGGSSAPAGGAQTSGAVPPDPCPPDTPPSPESATRSDQVGGAELPGAGCPPVHQGLNLCRPDDSSRSESGIPAPPCGSAAPNAGTPPGGGPSPTCTPGGSPPSESATPPGPLGGDQLPNSGSPPVDGRCPTVPPPDCGDLPGGQPLDGGRGAVGDPANCVVPENPGATSPLGSAESPGVGGPESGGPVGGGAVGQPVPALGGSDVPLEIPEGGVEIPEVAPTPGPGAS
ncbi:hypothetical protein ACFYUD_11340 [Nocardia tengchongensis]|uniref:hypothetical protein n=1 Tax=Nocardia tengchongensis TaxID=2055889 RepID=UPI0036C5D3B0